MNVLKKHLISRVLSIALSVLMALTNPMAAYAAEDGYVPEDEYAEQIEQLRSEVTFVIEDENPDKNVSSIPEDEELPEGGTNEEVDKPPKVKDSPGDTETPDPNRDGEPTISPEVTPETTLEVTPEITPETTPKVTPSEDPDSPTPTEEVKEPEPTEEPSPTPIVLIEFDHYYSEITESAVNTPELMIKTSNPDVFTKNTNVISNYDDVYIIECASVQEARYVYSYYINKVDFISDLSEVMTLASDGEEKHEEDVADLENLNESEDAISQLNEIVPEVQKVDYSDYIALIDTGANADVNFSVVGENTADDNGHGTKMLELIKSANPNAKVMSIKVFNGSTTTVADVYAGIKLAIESDVKVINLSLVGANIQKNAILKEIIQEALDKGIIVIGAAGNNNTNAKNYIPGCIDGVIVVGAVNEDGTKYSTSNYNASVYVVATSTSEATAIYTGLYTADHLDDGRIFTTLKDPNENPPIDEPIEIPSDTQEYYKIYFPNYDVRIDEDGTVYFTPKASADIKAAADYNTPTNLGNKTINLSDSGYAIRTVYTGTCTLSNDSETDYGGDAWASNFSGNNAFTQLIGTNRIYASCERWWNGDPSNSTHAAALPYRSDICYRAEVISNDGKSVNFQIRFSRENNNFEHITWSSATTQLEWQLVDYTTCTNGSYGANWSGTIQLQVRTKVRNGNWSSWSTVYSVTPGMTMPTTTVRANIATKINTEINNLNIEGESGNKGPVTQSQSNYDANGNSIANTANWTDTSPTPSQIFGYWSEEGYHNGRRCAHGTVTLTYQHTSMYQIYRASVNANAIGSLSIIKNVDPAPTVAKDFYFYITGPNGYTNRVTISVSSTGTATSEIISDLVPGSYTVTEVDSPTSTTAVGSTFDYEVTPSASQTKDVPGGADTIVFEFTNTDAGPFTVRIIKSIDPSCSSIVNGLSYYTLNGATFEVFTNAACTNHAHDINGNNAILVLNNTNTGDIEFRLSDYSDLTYLYVKETKSGRGYTKNTTVYPVTVPANKGDVVQVNITNTPIFDPLTLRFEKISNTSGTTNFDANVDLSSARYTLTYYALNTDGTTFSSTATRTWVFKPVNGIISFMNTSYLVSGTLYTDTNNAVQYPFGRYTLEETTPPNGAKRNTDVYEIRFLPNTPDGTNLDASNAYISVNGREIYRRIYGQAVWRDTTYTDAYGNPLITTDAFRQVEEEIWAKIGLQKVDAVTGSTTPEGIGSFNGAQFRVLTNMTAAELPDGFSLGATYSGRSQLRYNNADIIITTGANGYGETSVELPYNPTGYWLLEMTAPAGYVSYSGLIPVTEWDYDSNYRQTGFSGHYVAHVNLTNYSEGAIPQMPISISITGHKRDAVTGTSTQGNGSLAGIKFAVVTRNANAIKYPQTNTGTSYANGTVVAILTSNASGNFSITGLPIGNYDVYELRSDATITAGTAFNATTYASGGGVYGTSVLANASYLWANSSKTVRPSTGDTNFAYDIGNYNDVIVKGNISIKKVDSEGNTDSVLSLAGIKYAIVNRSSTNVTFNGTSYANGRVVYIATLPASGTVTVSGLPYGDYAVYELRSDTGVTVNSVYDSVNKGTSVYANNSYLFIDKREYVQIRTQDQTVEANYDNPPKRGDFTLTKYAGTNANPSQSSGNRLAYIPFRITNNATGETHIIITDANGLIDTFARGKSASTINRLDASSNINASGWYVGALNATAASYNVWFGNDSAVNTSRGALLPGTYTLEELRCENNKNYALITRTFTIDTNGQLYNVDTGISIDPRITITTKATDLTNNTNELTIGTNVPLRDHITLTNLLKTNTYQYGITLVVTDFAGNYKRILKDEVKYNITLDTSAGANLYQNREFNADITADTSSVVSGEQVVFVTKLYETIPSRTQAQLIVHNDNYADVNERLRVIDYKIDVKKAIASQYQSFINGNPYYSLNGASFYVYTDADCTTRAKDKNGNDIVITLTGDAGSVETITSNTVTLNKYHGTTLYAKEINAGRGFALNTTVASVTVPTATAVDDTTVLTFNFTNVPLYDDLALQKISDKNLNSFSGEMLPTGARYTVKYYYANADGTMANTIVRTWVFEVDNNGKIDFTNASQKISGGNLYTLSNGTVVMPIGYYVIEETTTPNGTSGKYGLAKDTNVYTVAMLPNNGSTSQRINTTVTVNNSAFGSTTYNASNTQTVTSTAKITIGSTTKNLYADGLIYSVETEVWAPLGIVKADQWYFNNEVADSIMRNPQGNAKYQGAQYQVFLNINPSADFFNVGSNVNPNGSKVITAGSGITSIAVVNGIGTAGTTSFGTTLYPVLVDGQPLIITIGANGYGETSVKLPYSDDYRLVEIKASEGYATNQNVIRVSNRWFNDSEEIVGFNNYDAHVNAIPVLSSHRSGTSPEKVLVYSLEGYKVDANTKTTNSATGDASLNGIKYAIINRSDNAIVINSADYQSNSHIQTATNIRFNVGEVVAIVTTYRNNNKDGYWTMNGLPYGKYEVVELRSDNTVALHDVFDNLTSEKLGTSVTANASYMYTDTRDSSEILAYNQYSVESLIITVNGDSTPANNTTVSSTYTGDRVVSYNNGIYIVERAFKNYPVRGSIQVIKKDYETTDGTPQGINSLAGIKYAVVNRSTQSVYVIGYGVVATGKVVAILTTNEDGEVITPNMTYGTYDIYELRQDATIVVGDTYDGSAKLGTSNYVNDYYLYCDDMAKLTVNNPEYSVEEKREVYHITPGQTVADTFLNPSKRGGEFIFKFDMGGHRMPYIPFVLMLVEAEADGTPIKDADGNYTVIEQHTIIGDANGVIRSDRNPTSSTINTLDSYYNQATGYYTGPLDSTASAVPIWFGSTNYVNRYRGALIPGTYVLQELRADTNYGYAMSSISFRITEDNEMVYPEDAVVNPKINITSIAWDVNSQSDVLTVGTSVQLRDTVQFINLKYDDTYGYKTVIYITDDAGNILDDSFYTSPIKQLDLGARPNPTDEVCTLCEDVQIITVNTSTLEKGKTVNMVVELYQKINNNWTENPIAAHNTNADVDKQKLIIPDISTEAVNKTTGSRLASLDGKTIADDKIVYTNFGNEHTWLITGKLVDDAGNVIKDVNGNACQIIPISLYTSKANTAITVNGTINIAGMLMKSVSGPISGEFTLSQLGLGDFELPNYTYENAHFVISVINTANSQEVLSHNADLDVEDEVIRYMQLNTVASSSDDLQGVLPNSTSATLKDTLNYSNLVENTAVKVVGKVYEVKVVDGVKTVDLANPVTTKTVSETWTNGSGTKVMTFTFDSTPYAGKDLVVYEYVYTTIGGTDVLIGEHALADDAMQTVSIPKISTFMYVRHKDSNDDYTLYKMVSRRIESVELRDIVSFENLNTNYYWTFIGTLMDKTAQAPVKDKFGNNVTTTVTFKPATKDGNRAVNYIFNQDIADIEWDDINWYVSFEEVHSGEAGHTTLVYTEHKDYDDARQTVNVPSLRTTANSNDTTHVKQIVGKPNQVVTDTIEFNNFNKYASAGDTFTIKMEALYEDGSAVMNGTNPYVVTKTITWNGQTSENISMTLDGTPLIGKTIVFKETIYYGESTNAVDELMVENALAHVEEMITVPEIKTTALDSETNSETVSLTRVIVDTLELNRILPDTDFVITTKVFDKDANAFLKNNDGTDFVVTTNYHSPATSTNNLVCEHCGKVYAVDDTTTINIDLSAIDGLDGKTLVVYEYMPYQNNFYAEHVNKDDVNQTVKVPEIKTMFLNTETGTHVAALGTAIEVVDTVTYKNLIGGEAYTMTCKLIDKNSETVFDTKTETFTADASGNGTVEIKFTIDTTTLEGKRLVAYETCAVGGVDIAKHEDLNDEDQTVRVPVLRTTLIDVVIDDHMTAYNTSEVLKDTVTYGNLQEGLTYKIVGTLYNKETETSLGITAEKEFKAGTDGAGSVEMTFTVDSVALAGIHIVAFEDVYFEAVKVGTHSSMDDDNQTVGVPDIKTVFTDPLVDIANTSYGESVTVNDKVSYVNLLPLHEYKIVGILMDKATNAPVLDKEGKEITVEKKFTPTELNGNETVSFTIDTEFLKGKVLVAFEELYYIEKDVVVARHHNINDVDQTLYIPEIKTTLVSVDTDEHIVPVVDADVVLEDTVTYKNLIPGEEYVLKGVLIDKKTGNPVEIDGHKIEGTTPFTPTSAEGSEVVTFTFNSLALKGTTVVAFEELYHNDVLITIHADVDDENQTVDIPDIKTSFFDTDLETTVIDGEVRSGQVKPSVTLKDIVTYTNLNPAYEYTVTGTLMYKDGSKVLVDGNPITASTTFTPSDRTGTVEVVFENINTELLASQTIVAFETLTRKTIEIVTHADLEDKDQTIKVPEIGTTLVDKLTQENVVVVGKNVELVDTVAFKNLIVGKTYTLNGTLYNKATGEAIKDSEDKLITATTTFVAETEDGTVDVVFKFNTDEFTGETLVAFETLLYNGIEIETHANIDDESQTVYVPEIGTTLYDAEFTEDDDVVTYRETVTLVDIVEYKNLVPEKEYTLNGTIMDKATGKALVGKDGKEITASVTFKPETANGTVNVEFEIDSTILPNTTLVAFETLVYNGVDVLVHADIDDVAQTVRIPEIHTTATDVYTEEHVGVVTETTKIVDVVEYTNLIPDKEYTVIGTLVDKETGDAIKDAEDKEITKTVKFTVEKPEGYTDGDGVDGTVEVIFDVDSTLLRGKTVVVFEDLYYKDKEVAIHMDIDDENQTVQYPDVKTLLISVDTEDHIVPSTGKVKVVDTVSYTNLLIGKEYVVTGKLIDKDTNKALTNEDSTEVIGTTTFTPTTTDGNVKVEFEIDATVLTDKTYVAFESLTFNDIVVVTHEDINDELQTVYIPELHTTARDKADDDKILDGTQTEQTIVDAVECRNLIVGKEYTIIGKLAVKREYAEGEDLEYVVDADDNIITSEVTFVAEESDCVLEVEFTFDASKYAGNEIVVFESIYFNNVEIATHADIEDENQTVDISLFLHVKIAKVDHDNIKYVLRGAEITIFDEEGNVVLDIDGNECIGVTDETGMVDFTILYDRNKTYYAKETKAPEGFNICDDLFEVTPSSNRDEDEESGVCLIPLQIRDRRIVIPPKTGDDKPIGLAIILFLIGILCVGAFFAYKIKFSGKPEEDEEYNAEEDNDELISALNIDDIDGDAIVSNDIKPPIDS